MCVTGEAYNTCWTCDEKFDHRSATTPCAYSEQRGGELCTFSMPSTSTDTSTSTESYTHTPSCIRWYEYFHGPSYRRVAMKYSNIPEYPAPLSPISTPGVLKQRAYPVIDTGKECPRCKRYRDMEEEYYGKYLEVSKKPILRTDRLAMNKLRKSYVQDVRNRRSDYIYHQRYGASNAHEEADTQHYTTVEGFVAPMLKFQLHQDSVYESVNPPLRPRRAI
ncbi:hypothetical protein F4808DRAFT_463842 [Astrocystis sublimbata]|nr:hypothetical protein F4808DRAFT_463842 [Astrocystis sublimbata]